VPAAVGRRRGVAGRCHFYFWARRRCWPRRRGLDPKVSLVVFGVVCLAA
jgi:hypothetical protein